MCCLRSSFQQTRALSPIAGLIHVFVSTSELWPSVKTFKPVPRGHSSIECRCVWSQSHQRKIQILMRRKIGVAKSDKGVRTVTHSNLSPDLPCRSHPRDPHRVVQSAHHCQILAALCQAQCTLTCCQLPCFFLLPTLA